MKKLGVLVLLVMILLGSFLVIAQEKTGDVGEYAETVGVYLLKFQNLLMGALSFVSLGVFKEGGMPAFAQFLFMILLFMIFYSLVGFFIDKFNFLISLILTAIVFSAIDAENIYSLLYSYESMGVAISVALPVLILLTFTFRMYQRAYEGKSEKSPFYVEIFNLVFLVFFGIFFIRYSASEDGVIGLARLGSGWILIGLGISQLLVYKIFAKMFHNWFHNWWSHVGGTEEAKIIKMKRDAFEKIKDKEAEEMFETLGISENDDYKTSKGAYRKKMKEVHPDVGGSEESFKKVNSAWEGIKKKKGWRF